MVGPTFLTDLVLSKIISWIILNHIILIINIYIICSNYFPVTILVILSPWSSCSRAQDERRCAAGHCHPCMSSGAKGWRNSSYMHIMLHIILHMLNDVEWCWYIVNSSILIPFDDFASFCQLWAKFQLISVVQASQWQRALALFSAWHLA